MNTLQRKQAIEDVLKSFAGSSLVEASLNLFEILGYKSGRRLTLEFNTPKNFVAQFAQSKPFKADQALVGDWHSVDFLFQLTDSEVQEACHQQLSLFSSQGKYNDAIIESYLFLAIELKPPNDRVGDRQGRIYTRTELSAITRAVNRLFEMPVMVLFRHGDVLTLAIIRRRLHKRDESKDVLEKVTLIKDIRISDPLRAHIEILYDLSLPALHDEFFLHNFVGLHQAWENRLDSYALNKRFYHEVANWYFWALQHPGISYPRNVKGDEQCSIFLIRLLTRLVFCWFLQEKGLIPRDIFRRRYVERMLKDFSPSAGTFYQAFLQNLFFATLNQESDKREFRKKYEGSRDGNRGVTNLYRYADLLADPQSFVQLLRQVPFVNGGLFDCLDSVHDQKDKPNIRLDDFSEEKGNPLCIPNEIFFGQDREVDLSEIYGNKRHGREHARGLIEIFGRFKFTVEESTPLEEEIALDPELLGRVFENLLASYNEDTRTTARKATGSYYTPRQIVSYMVDEALISYLETCLKSEVPSSKSEFEPRLRTLLAADPTHFQTPFTAEETSALIAAIDRVKIIDPACGSGAFPMGALHSLVDLLRKIDPNNRRWKEQQLTRARSDRYLAEQMKDEENRTASLRDIEARVSDIERSFDTRFHALDFARKLYLIENCIYGVDIQPIACQIAKLRFFIALIVDQNVNDAEPNRGFLALPNLETKIVAADSLIPIERPSAHQFNMADQLVRPLRQKIEKVRHEYFLARTPDRKRKCRQQDAELRGQIANLLSKSSFSAKTANALATWDPYDQNTHASFFDPEWMFGLSISNNQLDKAASVPRNTSVKGMKTSGQPKLSADRPMIEGGFDIAISNPPYIRIQTLKQKDPKLVEFLKKNYESASKGNYDIYVVFVERSLQLLKSSGNLAFILPHKFFNAQYGEPLRSLLAKGKHVSHVVHFGDHQVFPGATNYVCLLFLFRGRADHLRFVKVDDLIEWFRNAKGSEANIPCEKITGAEWNFAVGRSAGLFDQFSTMPSKLGEVANIFVGLQTSADDVFILKFIGEEGKSLRVYSKSLERDIILEKGLLHPLVSGTDVRGYQPLPNRQFILFPYHLENKAELIPFRQIADDFPRTAQYLEKNRERLQDRENGRMRGPSWYGYIYLKNMTLQGLRKICVPRLVEHLHASLDIEGNHFLDNVDVGGVLWKAQYSSRSLQLLMALLNSAVLRWYFPHVSAPFRGGFRSANRQFLSQLPVPLVNNRPRKSFW